MQISVLPQQIQHCVIFSSMPHQTIFCIEICLDNNYWCIFGHASLTCLFYTLLGSCNSCCTEEVQVHEDFYPSSWMWLSYTRDFILLFCILFFFFLECVYVCKILGFQKIFTVLILLFSVEWILVAVFS